MDRQFDQMYVEPQIPLRMLQRELIAVVSACWALPSTRKFFRHYGPDPATEDLLRRADEWIQFRRWCEFVEGRSAD